MAPMNPAPRILLASRQGDGLTLIDCVDDVDTRLQLLQAYGVEIAATFRTARSRHALEVARELKHRFALAALEPGGPWFAVEYHQAMDALREYDMATGQRARRGSIGIGDPVHVTGAGYGTVKGYSPCGRARVSIERYANVALEVLAPASLVESLA